METQSKLKIKPLDVLFVVSDIIFFGTIMMLVWLKGFDSVEIYIIYICTILFLIDIIASYFLKDHILDPGKRIILLSLFILAQGIFIFTTYIFYLIPS